MKLTLALSLAFAAFSLPAQQTAQQTIAVTGDAEIKVVPDQVVLSLGVEVHSKILSEARRENDSRVRQVREAVLQHGVEARDVQTDFIQLGMQYQNDGVTVQYYYTRKSIVVVLREVNRMEEVLSAAVEAGATHVHGVEFETTRLREHRDQARALAVKAATEKARDMAAAAGLKVVGNAVGISSASYGGRSWYGSGWYGRSTMMSQNVSYAGSGSEPAQGTVALGRISVTAAVSMTFRIE